MKTIGEMLRAIVDGRAGEITDEEVRKAAYEVEYFEITAGTEKWHTCTREELGAFVDAHALLRKRLDALRAPVAPVNTAVVELIGAIAHAEDRAQDAEDREQLSKASEWRRKATKLKAELAKLQGAS